MGDLAIVHSGERTGTDGKAIANRILLALSDSDFRTLRPHLQYLSLRQHDILHEPNQKPKFTYFPNDGMISLVVVMRDGRTVEAGIAGREGVAGLACTSGLTTSPLREIVQISGDGFRIAVASLQEAMRTMHQLQAMLSRYAVLLGLQVSQTAACNRLHETERRLARWLLMTQDRVDSGNLKITHDFLATMLGTDRPSITQAACRLQSKRLIAYSRGSVKILNRKKLELSACECYEATQQFNGALGLK